MRFPKVGDKYGSKSLTKIFLNKKVPLFWRNFIPILEKEGKIVAVLPIAEQEARR
ncbi:MAG: tRNA lysidine(34) synthetase TilS [Candidatus Peribacteria bacterium]|nr:MAG: tRNA lysidine(34) synthetase TilS [Candidatus Peribacteria bacterium]